MPAGNRMGPNNMGPRTGRGMGYCAGYDAPGNMRPGFGTSGFGRGASGGRGYRNWFHATGLTGWQRMGGFRGAYPPPNPMTEEDEQEMLRDQEKWLEEQLKDVRGRLKEDPEK